MSCRIGPTACWMTSVSRPVGLAISLCMISTSQLAGSPMRCRNARTLPCSLSRTGASAGTPPSGGWACNDFLEGVLPRLDVQVFLAAEMVVHGGGIGPGLLANLGVGGLPEPLLGKDLRRGIQQPLPRFLCIFSLPSFHADPFHAFYTN